MAMIRKTLWGGLLAASLLLAQAPRGRAGLQQIRERQSERMESMAKAVELNGEQREEIEAIEREMLIGSRGAGRDLMEARQALEAAKTEAEVDERAAVVAKLSTQMMAARQKAELKIRKLLTPAQVEKYDAWRKAQRPLAQRE